ncbi:DUF624 domain-containing protein [Streptococcus sp. S784/96/1]|uniref:DUF624 domain-containing protein n=1 Tax=Streptococcus sp. S784/96/1 TaxID=2653499 RepID=UPI001389905A|nr:DUF624 domain-containing protein [Streptococcus sp. S784/96/1]
MDRLDSIFARLFVMMKLSMIGLTLSACAGFVLGVSPAAAVLLTLYHEHGLDAEEYQFKTAFQLFRKQFWQANAIFGMTVGFWGLLGYGIFFMVQLPQAFFFLTVINLFGMCYVGAVYASYLKLQVYYEFTLIEGLKLSAMAVFLSLVPFMKLLIGTGICLFIGWKLPLIIGIFVPVLWLVFLFDVLEPIYYQVEQRLS